ncbi:DUF4189 domain-containing protein [Neisseria musculi]|uniref:DUF4189 domain-containing protein n=1 Tax=Neisseria musculi TaxID=1815583 RepID=A0A7H1M872_9NEIS|nr:DUF4189 domain-containing protein [Neisseria musculi]QNT57837.1 hypothetical protein H7A79_2487 [Neisseria musculi]
MRTIFKYIATVGVVWLGFAGVGFAQPMSNEMAQGIYDEEVRKKRAQQQQGANTDPSAAEVRAWHERERKIQAEIAQHRATPYWMVIGRDWGNKKIAWSGGYASKERAIEWALSQCESSDCRLIATIANACGVIVYAHENPKSISDIFIGVDPDDKKAAAKAMQSCEAVHRKNNPDRCFYSGIQTKHGTAFCTGYDYSVYGQQ